MSQAMKKVFRLHLVNNSQLLAEKLGHLCATCVSEVTGGGCCKTCAPHQGHFQIKEWSKSTIPAQQSEISQEDLDKLKKEFNFQDRKEVAGRMLIGPGFLTPTGCALPRERRSLTCLTYSCFTWHDKADEETNKQLTRLSLSVWKPSLGYNYKETK